LINDSFVECIPTPGSINIAANFTQNNQTNQTNNTDSTNSALCDLSLGINTDSTVYNLSTIYFDLFVNDTNCNGTQHNVTINYFIEDMFGDIVKEPLNTTREIVCTETMQRQWTPDAITGSEAYNIRGGIIDTGCNDTDATNNNASKLIVVKGNSFSQNMNSSIEILSVDAGSDNSVKYGETADIELKIYRGNTNKYAIYVWIEDSGTKLSEISTIHANNKFTEYKLQIPVQLKNNCDGALKDGTYMVVAEGLNLTTNASINVSGISSSNCKTITVTVSSGSSGSSSGGSSGGGSSSAVQALKFSHEIINYSQNVSAGGEFSAIVRITNNYTTNKNFTIYSYVYRGTNIVSLGYDELSNKWYGTYTANSKTFSLKPQEFLDVVLKNRIEDGTEPGLYNFRIRIKVDGKDNDITRELLVTEPVAEEDVSIYNNTTESNIKNNNTLTNNTVTEKTKETPKITGLVSARQNKIRINPLGSPFVLLLDLLLSLFS